MDESSKEMKSEPESSSDLDAGAAENARRMADLFLFFANILNHPPDIQLLDGLRESLKSGLLENSFQQSSGNPVNEGIRDLQKYFTETAETKDEDIVLQLAVDWTRLFRGIRPGYGPPPPYEGVYVSHDKIGVETIQEINKIFYEYGVGIEGSIQNRPDYLGFEFDFLRHLFDSEAQAWLANKQEDAVNFHMGGMQFFSEHIYPWVPKFIEKALPHAKTKFYEGFLRIVQETITNQKNFQDL